MIVSECLDVSLYLCLWSYGYRYGCQNIENNGQGNFGLKYNQCNTLRNVSNGLKNRVSFFKRIFIEFFLSIFTIF